MTEEKIIKILKKVNAIITDSHIVLTSGRHSSGYINKDKLYPYTLETSKVGRMIADQYKDKKIDVVVGPALGGIILSQWTAYHLTQLCRRNIFGVYTEKKDGDQVFTREYDLLVKGKRVLVVEDLTATGGSARKVVNSVRGIGGKVVGVCVMVNRDSKRVTSKVIGAPFKWLGLLEIESHDEKRCPLCKTGVPINTDVGHGKEFLKKKKGRKG